MNILYCGPYFSELAVRQKPSISQAGVRWSLGLVNALRAQGHHVEVISHCAEQMWPRGKIFWQSAAPQWFYDADCHRIAYPNLPFLRDVWINASYARQVRRACKNTRFDAFLCYNTIVPCHVAAMKAAKKSGVFCAPIILDGDDPNRDNWGILLTNNRYANGVVFLSYWLKEHYPESVARGGKIPVYHLDGGSDKFHGEPPVAWSEKHKFTVAHTGSLNPKRELAFIAKMLKEYKDLDTRFVFTGKIDREMVMEKVDHDPRVEVIGMVGSDELNRICADVDAFISARSPSIVDFPSKLPNYLSWGRPVVSTWVESFSPDYREVLFVADNNAPEGMAAQLEKVRQLSLQQRMDVYERISTWFKAKKTWGAQAAGLVKWLEGVV